LILPIRNKFAKNEKVGSWQNAVGKKDNCQLHFANLYVYFIKTSNY